MIGTVTCSVGKYPLAFQSKIHVYRFHLFYKRIKFVGHHTFSRHKYRKYTATSLALTEIKAYRSFCSLKCCTGRSEGSNTVAGIVNLYHVVICNCCVYFRAVTHKIYCSYFTDMRGRFSHKFELRRKRILPQPAFGHNNNHIIACCRRRIHFKAFGQLCLAA